MLIGVATAASNAQVKGTVTAPGFRMPRFRDGRLQPFTDWRRRWRPRRRYRFLCPRRSDLNELGWLHRAGLSPSRLSHPDKHRLIGRSCWAGRSLRCL
jgi:hypothetical protein